MPQPSNATFLAAELATQLCSLGRRYTRLSERLANGIVGPVHHRVARKRARLFQQALDLIQPYPRLFIATDDGLFFKVCSRPSSSIRSPRPPYVTVAR